MSESLKESVSKSVFSVNRSVRIADAAILMKERGVRHLSVTDDGGAIVGLLSARDLQRPHDTNAPVSDLMTWPIATADEGLSLREAAQRMIDEKTSALVVTGQSNAIAGIMTSDDMLKALVDLLGGEGLLRKATYSPLIGEILREVQAAGL